MNNQWAVFDDGSVAYIGADKRSLYGFGPNSNQQFTAAFGTNCNHFREISLTLYPNEEILGIYAGGSSAYGDNALFVLCHLPADVETTELVSGQHQAKKYKYPMTRLLVCGQNLQSYFPGVKWAPQNAGVFIDIPLPQAILAGGTREEFVSLPIKNIAVYQNNVVVLLETQWCQDTGYKILGEESIFKASPKQSPIWANINAIKRYIFTYPAAFGAMLPPASASFTPINFPIHGDKTGAVGFRKEVPRKPTQCYLGEFFMIIVTDAGKAYFFGQNKRRAGGEWVLALSEKCLKKTGTGEEEIVGWSTITYEGHRFIRINQVVISDNSQIIMDAKWDEKQFSAAVINLSQGIQLARTSAACAVYQDNVALVLADRKDLQYWGRKISDFLAKPSHAPLLTSNELMFANQALSGLPEGYKVTDIHFSDSRVYLLTQPTAIVSAAAVLETTSNYKIFGFGVHENNILLTPALIELSTITSSV